MADLAGMGMGFPRINRAIVADTRSTAQAQDWG
jgi:hypothetical protein